MLRASLAGLIRLVHPFPSVLDGAVTVAVALVAGADAGVAIRLGLSMVALQASIGALNDVLDAEHDAGRKPGKPIPSGQVSRDVARGVVVVGAGLGIALAVASGPTLVALAGTILIIGYAYDLVFKGTSWSWVPFAVGVPLLPVFGWLGTTGSLPMAFALLLPTAVLAGAGLAVANARADEERDTAAGLTSIATRLGSEVAWRVHAVLLGLVVVVAFGSLVLAGVPAAALGVALAAGLVVMIGIVLGRSGPPERRERAWELEATGIGLLAAVWLAGLSLGGWPS